MTLLTNRKTSLRSEVLSYHDGMSETSGQVVTPYGYATAQACRERFPVRSLCTRPLYIATPPDGEPY